MSSSETPNTLIIISSKSFGLSKIPPLLVKVRDYSVKMFVVWFWRDSCSSLLNIAMRVFPLVLIFSEGVSN